MALLGSRSRALAVTKCAEARNHHSAQIMWRPFDAEQSALHYCEPRVRFTHRLALNCQERTFDMLRYGLIVLGLALISPAVTHAQDDDELSLNPSGWKKIHRLAW